jgi:hypothetical protein
MLPEESFFIDEIEKSPVSDNPSHVMFLENRLYEIIRRTVVNVPPKEDVSTDQKKIC